VSRSLRHPFRGSRRYVRPERSLSARPRKTHQPRMRQNRFSVEAALQAPDTTEARPGLRLRIIAVAVVLLFCILGLRLWALQALQAPAAAKAVAADEIRVVPVEPTRGLILDRYGNPLVDNVVTYQITLSRVAAVQNPQVVGTLAALIGQTTAQVEATIADKQYSPYKPVPILSAAPLPDILYIKEHPGEFPGVSAVATTQRNYPQLEISGPASAGYPAEHALGFVGTISPSELKASAGKGYQPGDDYGQSGLEYQYQSQLRGTPGSQQLEVDPQGQVVGTVKTTPAVAGDDLVTNLDTGLQQVVDNALSSQILSIRGTPDPDNGGAIRKAPNGAAVVLDPQTGAVLAISSYPFYNPNIWVGGISDANYAALQASEAQNDYSIDGELPPGSTFKLTTATAALQTGLITPSTIEDDDGSYTAPDCKGPSCTLHDDIGDKPFHEIDLTTALTVSSDVFFYQIGAEFWDDQSRYGQTPIQNTAAQYGYGNPTGIDLPNEASGLVGSPAIQDKLHAQYPKDYPYPQWYTGNNMELAFGQGLTEVTPLQQAVAYSTFANGGTRYQPQVVAAAVSPSGKVVQRMSPKVAGHITYSAADYAAMLQGFEGVIDNEEGTGYAVFGGAGWNEQAFPLAGKTGTASVNGEEPVSWFVGFGPLPDPQYVVVVDINQGGYGVDAAAPVVRNIFNYLAAHPVTAPGIPPDPAVIRSPNPVPLPTAPSTTTTTVPGSTITGSTTTTTAPGA
jgi:penicillin-binding protein 2